MTSPVSSAHWAEIPAVLSIIGRRPPLIGPPARNSFRKIDGLSAQRQALVPIRQPCKKVASAGEHWGVEPRPSKADPPRFSRFSRFSSNLASHHFTLFIVHQPRQSRPEQPLTDLPRSPRINCGTVPAADPAAVAPSRELIDNLVSFDLRRREASEGAKAVGRTRLSTAWQASQIGSLGPEASTQLLACVPPRPAVAAPPGPAA